MAEKKSTRPTDREAWREGARIAVALLRYADRPGLADGASLSPEFRDGKPHDNFVAGFLRQAVAMGDERVVDGFAAVLSEFLACACDGGAPDVPVMAQQARKHLASAMQGVRYG